MIYLELKHCQFYVLSDSNRPFIDACLFRRIYSITDNSCFITWWFEFIVDDDLLQGSVRKVLFSIEPVSPWSLFLRGK